MTKKKVIATLVVLLAVGLAIGGFFVYRYTSSTIGGREALNAALKHAGLEKTDIYDVDTDYEYDRYMSVYEVEFKAGGLEYNYVIRADNGEVLAQSQEYD